MRRLSWLLVVAALLWAGYWALAVIGIERGVLQWTELRRSEGWLAEVATIRTSGFPLAFETRFEDISLVDPETGLGWTAPQFDFRAEAYAPTYLDARWPEMQEILTPFETIGIEAAEIRAGIGLVPGPTLALDTSEMSLSSVFLRSSAGWTARLEDGSLETRRLEDDPLAHAIAFSAHGLKPAGEFLKRLDPLEKLPTIFTSMELDMEAAFDVPWDRHAIEDRRPQPTALNIRLMKALWGPMKFEAAGTLKVDDAGMPEGDIAVRAVNWRDMLEVAETGGWVPLEFLPTIRRGLEILAGLSGNPETIDATLRLSGGFVRLGPVPLGPAPVLRIR
ncbi:MAG: DUF2125 domain-containing protein [Pseudomonadota bacterium]